MKLSFRTTSEMHARALTKIERLRDIIASQNERIEELENELAEAEEYDIYYADDEDEEPEEIVFLRDIGFDPDRLPSSVGERMAIRNVLEAARALK